MRPSKCAVSRVRELNCLKNEQHQNACGMIQLELCAQQRGPDTNVREMVRAWESAGAVPSQEGWGASASLR